MQCVVCLALLIVLVAMAAAVSPGQGQAAAPRRIARGFRMGAADRFSHGFGKRTEGDTTWENETDTEELVMSNEEMADLLRSSDRLALLFVQRYVDSNGDGAISKTELYDGARK